MTTFKKFLGLGMMLAAFAIAGAVPAFAQGCDDVDGIAALDAKIREAYAKVATLPTAITSGKEFLEKYGTCPTTADFSTWLKGQIPAWEKLVNEGAATKKREALYAKYVSELGASKWDDAIATSKELLTVFPADKSLNIYIPLASIGLYESYKKNDKYVDVSIQNAKIVLDKYKANEESLKGSHGIAPYSYPSKDDAVSEMKFILGYLLTVKKGDKKNGVTYLYDVAQSPGMNKTNPALFVQIGEYYLEQAGKVGAEIAPLQKQLNAADEEIKKAGTAEERISELNKQKIELNKQIVAKEGYYFAWVERAIDSYSRAHKNAKDVTPAEKEYRKVLYTRLETIYEDRFKKKDGIDSYIATAVAKPMPNPTSDVTPVVEATTDTTTGGSSAVSKPETPTAATKPAEKAVTGTTAKARMAKPRK